MVLIGGKQNRKKTDPLISKNEMASVWTILTNYFRFCFARSEVQLKKLVPAPFMKVFYCWRSVLGRALSRQRQVLRPYALRAIFFWACDRVKVGLLAQQIRAWIGPRSFPTYNGFSRILICHVRIKCLLFSVV